MVEIDEKMIRAAWAETRAAALAAMPADARVWSYCGSVDLPLDHVSAHSVYAAKAVMLMFLMDRSATGGLRVRHGDVILEEA